MKKLFFICKSVFVLLVLFVLVSNVAVLVSSKNLIYEDANDLPFCDTALVLGCPKILSGGRLNLFFKNRMDAAAELFKSGKIKTIIVSGDNSYRKYNEPRDMKISLIERSVPKENIYCDYAGFRTLDSVVRAKEIFGQDELIIVSQKFHLKRAIFIAKHKGISAVGYEAEEVAYGGSLKTRIRELFARVKMVLDIYFLKTKPKFSGQSVQINS